MILLTQAFLDRNSLARYRVARISIRIMAVLSALCLMLWYLVPLAFPLNEDALAGPPPSVLILDNQGNPLHHQARKDYYLSESTPLDGIPQSLIDATLAAEDKRFHDHGGVDILANLRAIKDSIEAERLVSGASTVTQQTIKLTTGSPARTFKTKIIEALSARHLEISYTKQEILACYLNHLDYGNLTQGPRQASLHYFGKELSELSLAQTALLAGLPQAPSRHNPRRNPNNAKKRRDWVLERMQITCDYPSTQIQRAINEPIQLIPRRSHQLQTQLAQLAVAHRTPGSRTIRTSIDSKLQATVERTLAEEVAKLHHQHVNNGAVVVIDNHTRQVSALVGTADFSAESGQINAALTPRSPGSVLKPFTYLLAIEKLHYSPATILADVPTQYAGIRGPEAFVNYDRKHRGPVSLHSALGNSLNVPAVRTLNALGGPRALHSFLQQLGFSTLTEKPSHYGLGLTLGSGPVTLIDVTNGFASIACQGSHTDYILFPDDQTTMPKRVCSAESAYLIASILTDNLARSATFGNNSQLRLPFPCAVKTGTSSDFRDNFCVGFTTDFTVGVWVGNLSNQPMKGTSGVTGAGPVFHQVMLDLHKNRPAHWLKKPANVLAIQIDPHTGKRLAPSHPRFPLSIHTFTNKDRIPKWANHLDYSQNGQVYLNDRFTHWLSETPQPPFIADQTRQHDVPLRVLSPARDATYLLDPDLPDRGAYLSLISNDPESTEWSSTSLEIIDHHKSPTLILTEGDHQVTAHHRATGKSSTIRFSVREL
ncbi:penicillin-binding protein 1C [Rubritalea profundi]|uniref:peptidoglycan glycosyltransferase n=1 Tax=Rubritalea profundi TaxID=1658618 RepID=A0A2S7U5T5_9BACT|nr:penicillin-binding protein 1C [Rubritalea profundi]PQJ29930.1 penicillin-binding protein 1C [Rubritalea profundi]